MKVRCIKRFASKGKEHNIDDVLNVSKEECSLLLRQGLCIMVREEEPKEKATPKIRKEKAIK